MKALLSLVAAATLVGAAEYKIDLMDDVFGLDLYELQKMKVRSASKSEQTLNFTPAKMVVVSKEQIEDRGYRGLDELLNDLPGFQVMRHADSGILNQIGIRGVMGNNYFKVLQDGIEIDQTDGEILSRSMQYPLFGIERVEILYGPASVVYGADAFSGVVNLVSTKSLSTEGGIAAGPKGYRYGYGVASFALPSGLLSLKAHYHRDPDYDFEKHYPDDYLPSPRNDEFDFQPHVSRSLGVRYENGGVELGANYRYSSESTLIAMNGGNSTSNIFDNDSNLDTELLGVYGRYTERFADDYVSTTTLSYDSTKLLEGSYFINKYTAYRPGYKYSHSERYALEETLSTHTGDHHLLAGFLYERFKSLPMTIDLPTPEVSGPVYFAGSDIEAPIYTIRWNNKAIYLQDQIALSEHLQLSLAARYDDSSDYGSTFNPRFALIHSTGEVTQKLIYSQGYLAPSNYQKYKIYGTPLQEVGSSGTYTTERYRVANPDLKPEKSKNYEYSLEWLPTPNDQLSLGLFYSSVKEIISNEESLPEKKNFIPNTLISDPVGAANSTRAVLYGGEIAYQGHSYFSGYDVSYWANYSYVDGKIDYAYAYAIPYSASHLSKAGGTLRFRDWRFSPSLRWAGPIMSAPFDEGKTERVGGHCVTNLFVRYDIDKTAQVALRVDNLFDERYYGVRYNSSSKSRSPQEARAVSLALTLNF